MEFSDLKRELEEVKKILSDMGTCYGLQSVKQKPVNMILEKRIYHK